MTVAYDGTRYAGWQVQPNGMTVQEEIETALRGLTSDRIIVHGSGRTDQGVHARGQVAHFDYGGPMTCAGLQRALNAVLPAEVRLRDLRETSSTFHARRSAVDKEYRYFIWNDVIVPPFVRLYRAQVPRRLDVARMQDVAAVLTGRHDFAAFTANPNRRVESTVRNLKRLQVTRHGAEITIVAVGDGFLYKMVRSLAGFLIRAGEGVEDASSAAAILASRTRTARVPTAAAEGLFLWKVNY